MVTPVYACADLYDHFSRLIFFFFFAKRSCIAACYNTYRRWGGIFRTGCNRRAKTLWAPPDFCLLLLLLRVSLHISLLPCFSPFFYPIFHPFIRVSPMCWSACKDKNPRSRDVVRYQQKITTDLFQVCKISSKLKSTFDKFFFFSFLKPADLGADYFCLRRWSYR